MKLLLQLEAVHSRHMNICNRASESSKVSGCKKLLRGRDAEGVAVRRHAACAVEESEIGFLLRQHRQEIGERRKDRKTDAPAGAILRPEQRHLPHDITRHDT